MRGEKKIRLHSIFYTVVANFASCYIDSQKIYIKNANFIRWKCNFAESTNYIPTTDGRIFIPTEFLFRIAYSYELSYKICSSRGNSAAAAVRTLSSDKNGINKYLYAGGAQIGGW